MASLKAQPLGVQKMIRVTLNGIDYDIGYQHGFYVAIASHGESPIGKTLADLSEVLSGLTGMKKEDILNKLEDLGC